MNIGSVHRPNVVITGFGPFRDHSENPSWSAIKDDQLHIDRPVNLVFQHVEVSYKAVDEIVPRLWEKYRPIMMVHIGLAAHENMLRLEQRARFGPYCNDDVRGFAPHSKNIPLIPINTPTGDCQLKCKDSGMYDYIKTGLNLGRALKRVEEAKQLKNLEIDAKQSDDAGLYVCEYIYLSSLKINENTVFVHIPDIKNFTLKQIRKGLSVVIECLIDCIMEENELNTN